MGHLINPVAFRLGWNKSWVDDYYVPTRYYPEFMHMLLRIRLYLLYFFRHNQIQKLGYLYSHFILSQSIIGFEVFVFYYDGRLEASWDELTRLSFSFKTRRLLGTYDLFIFQRFYFLLIILLLLNSLTLSRLNLAAFIYHFLKKRKKRKSFERARQRSQARLSKKGELVGFKRPRPQLRRLGRKARKVFKVSLSKLQKRNSFTKTIFLLFTRFVRSYFLLHLHRHVKYGRRRWSRSSWDYVGFGQHFFYVGVSYLLARPFFFHLGNYLSFILSRFSFFPFTKTSFFLISNNHVTASFLANYIAKRLKQGYRLTELINPLRRELSRVKRATSSKFRKLVNEGTLAGGATRLNYGSVFSRCLFFLFSTYRSQSLVFIKNSQTFVTYDFFLAAFSLAGHFFNHSYKKFFLLTQIKQPKTKLGAQALLTHGKGSNWKVNKLARASYRNKAVRRFSGILRSFFKRQPQNLFFYRVARANLYGTYLFLPLFFPGTFSLMRYPDYYFFLREMFDSFFSNFSLLCGSNAFSFPSHNLSSYPIYRAINIGFGGFLRYLRFNIFKFNLRTYYNLMKINRKNLRDFSFSPRYGLLGFKFHLKGRFTRKQIAASHVFRRGRLPLSTMSANIDYAFSTLALKNSAVGIKIWLYKADNTYSFYFKTI